MDTLDYIFLNLILISFLASFFVGMAGEEHRQKAVNFAILSALIWAVAPLTGAILPLLLNILLLGAVWLGAKQTRKRG